MTAREKFTRALREGRILRNAKGHIVIPEVVKPGVVLTRQAPVRTFASMIRAGDTVTAPGPDGVDHTFSVVRVSQSAASRNARRPYLLVRTTENIVSVDLDHPVTITRTKEPS